MHRVHGHGDKLSPSHVHAPPKPTAAQTGPAGRTQAGEQGVGCHGVQNTAYNVGLSRSCRQGCVDHVKLAAVHTRQLLYAVVVVVTYDLALLRCHRKANPVGLTMEASVLACECVLSKHTQCARPAFDKHSCLFLLPRQHYQHDGLDISSSNAVATCTVGSWIEADCFCLLCSGSAFQVITHTSDLQGSVEVGCSMPYWYGYFCASNCLSA